jgi:Tfp pilus assembly protein PilO
MNTETQNTKQIVQLKERIGHLTKPSILYGCCISFCLIILIFAYKPSIIKLHNAANKLHEVKIELLNQRSTIAALEKSEIRGEVMQRNEVPLALAELTEKGRELGLDFSSISPRKLQETTQAGIRKLPISFTIESEYKNIGQFLAFVEGFSRSVAEVESLFMSLRENNPPKLNVELVLNLYVETEVEIENAT